MKSSNELSKKITILGAGIAGITLAWHLSNYVDEIILIDRNENCAGDASGNPAGLVMPILGQLQDPAVGFIFHSFLHACDFYSENNQQNFWHQNGLQIELSSRKQNYLLNDPTWKNFLIKKSKNEVFIKTVGWLYPRQAASFMLSNAKKKNIKYIQAEIKTLQNQNSNWLAIDESGKIISSSTDLILSCGAYGLNFSNSVNAPLHPVRGQITTVENLESDSIDKNHNFALCRSGYALPLSDKTWLFGASFIRNDNSTAIRPQEEEQVLSEWLDIFPQLKTQRKNRESRAAIRAMTSDRLPIIGQALSDVQPIKKYNDDIFSANKIPGLWLFTGLGARGLTSAPILAKIFVEEFLGKKIYANELLPEKLKSAVSSTRFAKRKWLKN